MKKSVVGILTIMAIVFSNDSQAQTVSASGQFGWSSPTGTLFIDDATDEKLAGGGLGVCADVMYQSEDLLNNKLLVGGGYHSSVLIAVGDDITSFRFYGLSNYALKAQYNLLDGPFKPFGSLAMGVGVISTPELTSYNSTTGENEVSMPALYGYSFGLRPEFGFEAGGENGAFIMSFGMQVPTSYNIKDFWQEPHTAGAWQISLGYRYKYGL
tara:strand:+ start:484 stop:1119 length:636 start_codon:yes stop_codon:yes gene_type:complete